MFCILKLFTFFPETGHRPWWSGRLLSDSLVYGMEAVIPIEVEIPSMRVLIESKLTKDIWCQNRYAQLNLIEEKRMTILCHGQLYQKRMKNVFDKKVHPREFIEGDRVFKKILPPHNDSQGKWTPNY